MLGHGGQQVVNLSRRPEEYLALAILHILLYIKRNCLRDTEILHVLRYGHTQLLCQRKEVVDGMTGGKDNGRMVQDAHLLCTELFSCYPLDFDKRTEHEFNAKLVSDVVIGRLLAGWFWLGNQNLLDHLMS